MPRNGLANPQEIVDTAQILLEENAGNYRAVSRMTGMAESTVNSIGNSSLANAPTSAEIQSLKLERASFWDEILKITIQKMPAMIDKASFKDLAWAAAVATDKWLLLTGNATRRVEHQVSLSDYYRGELTRPKVVEALPPRVETSDVTEGEKVGGTPYLSLNADFQKGPSTGPIKKKAVRKKKAK